MHNLQPELLQAYQPFGELDQYFSLDGGQFPPRGAALFRTTDRQIILSVGMSLRPQPSVEMSVENPSQLRRIELALEIPNDTSAAAMQAVLEQFSGLVAWPWNGNTWFGDGHTCQLPALEELIGKSAQEIRFIDHEKREPASDVRMPAFRDDPIKLLWISPSSEI